MFCQTLVATTITGEAGVPFYQMAGSEFMEVLVDVGAARIGESVQDSKGKCAYLFPVFLYGPLIQTLLVHLVTRTARHIYDVEISCV